MKSARSLSKTIEGLIGKEKDRISDYYDSQIRSIKQSKLGSVAANTVSFKDQRRDQDLLLSSHSDQRNFTSQDLKGSHAINIMTNDESLCSFQSVREGFNHQEDYYREELSSHNYDSNPLQKSQLG